MLITWYLIPSSFWRLREAKPRFNGPVTRIVPAGDGSNIGTIPICTEQILHGSNLGEGGRVRGGGVVQIPETPE